MSRNTTHLHTFELKEKKLQLITVVLLIILLPLLLYLLQQALQIGIQGAPDAQLSLVPQGITQTVDQKWVFPLSQTVPVDIVLNSGTNQVEAVEATIFYDPTVLTLKGATGLASNNITCSQITPLKHAWVKQIAGLSVDTSGNQIGTETGSVTIVCSAVPPIDQWQNGVAVYQPTTVNFNSPIATLRFTTLKNTTNASLAFEFTPTTPTNDSSVLQYQGGCCSTTEVLSAVNNLTFDVGTVSGTPTPTGPTVTLSPTPTGPTVTPSPTGTITPTPTGPTVTPSPTPTGPTVTPTPTGPTPTTGPKRITLNCKLQGRTWPGAPKQRAAKFKLKKIGSATDTLGPIDVNIDTNGEVRINETTLASILAGEYELSVKPRGYLQRMIRVNINNGDNPFDMSATEFLGGDLDASGRINGLDYNVLLQQFRTTNELADIDGSGQVNGLDYSYMLSNWNKKGDGEGQ